ncbi:MAG: hypothetical protein OWQ51_07175 [Pyrobaculum arsenaticum]|uniref:hypothetical protein n=1 Tax=Pyrobaculum arsenaticum TaxID=121277 RepID=UPI0022752155|nr:hypothetical protein [Pyrobaculum arsenaticum]
MLMFERFKIARIFGPALKAAGGFKGLKLWREWSLYYAGVMVKAASLCGWSPEEASDDPVWQALTAVYWHHCGVFPEKPPKEFPEAWANHLAIIKWAAEHICERDLPEARVKYAELLKAPLYRAYRQALYKWFIPPLVRAGAVETVLSVGGGLVEPFDLLKVAEEEKIHFELYVQEVDDAVAKALAASGFQVYIGDLSKLVVDVSDILGKSYFDLAVVQAVLHWAEDPISLLTSAGRLAKYILVAQFYGPYAAAGSVATVLMGARRYIHDWREIEAWAEQAGLLPARDVPRKFAIRGYGLYIRLFQPKWAERKA